MNAASSPRTPDRGIAALLFTLALAACPREMREEYGEAMRADIAAGTRERGFAYGVRAYADVVAGGIAERFATICRDLAYAVRQMRRAPVFTLVIVATMAAAIGINGAMYGFIADVYFRALPVDDPATLTFLWERNAQRGWEQAAFTQPDADAVRRGTRMLTNVAVFAHDSGTVIGNGAPAALRGVAVNGDFFPAYRAKPKLGRLLTTADEREDAGTPIVISDQLWRTRYAADPGIIGRAIVLGDVPRTVVGIAPAGFAFLDGWRGGLSRTDYFVPLRADRYRRAGHMIEIVGRFAPGTALTAITADGSRILAEQARVHPDLDTGLSVRAFDVREHLYGPMRDTMATAAIAAFAVLIVACANVANLLLSRAAAREAEIGIRAALGASRGRLVAQLLTESTLSIAFGGVLGLVLAIAIVGFIARTLSDAQATPLFEAIGVDGRLLAITAGVVLVAALLAGLAPALTLARGNLSRTLKGGGRGGDRSVGRAARRALVSVEIAVALATVAAATMGVRNYQLLAARPLGFVPDRVWVAQLNGAQSWIRYNTIEKADAFLNAVRARVAGVPGVDGCAWSSSTPFYNTPNTTYEVAGRHYSPGSEPDTLFGMTSPGYFGLLRVPLLAGRDFRRDDRAHTTPVAIVNERFAKANFGTPQAALGQRVTIGFGTYDAGQPYRRIVGVVGAMRPRYARGIDDAAYMPAAQVPSLDWIQLVVRARPGVDVARAVREAITAVDPHVPAPVTAPLARAMEMDLLDQKLFDDFLACFALVALALAIAGICAVVAYDVSRRTNEIGVRMAFGAGRLNIVAMVLRETLRLASLGVVLGLALTVAATSLMTRLATQVSAFDPATYLLVVGALVSAVVLGAIVPALRAASVEPSAALRYE